MTKRSQKALSVGFLFDDTLDSTAGVAQYVKGLGAWLTEQGHHVFYMVGETNSQRWAGGQIYSVAKNVGVRFNANRLSTPLPTTRAAEIKRILNKEKPDILHVQVPYSPLMAQRIINQADARTAIIGTFCILPAGWPARAGLRSLKPLYGRSLKRFDKMLATSPAAAKFAKSSLGVDSTVLPNIVDLKAFESSASANRSAQKTIIFLGRLVERKGAYQLLTAFRLLHQRQPAVRLVLAGSGPQLKQLKAYVAKNQLQDVVSFPGFIAESQKAGLLSKADIACFPSLFGESFGISLLEGMASGAGVVLGGDNPGYRSVLGGKPMSLIDPRQTDDFAKRLETLLFDKKLIAELRDWQARAVRQYDINLVGRQLLNHYRQAIAKRQANR